MQSSRLRIPSSAFKLFQLWCSCCSFGAIDQYSGGKTVPRYFSRYKAKRKDSMGYREERKLKSEFQEEQMREAASPRLGCDCAECPQCRRRDTYKIRGFRDRYGVSHGVAECHYCGDLYDYHCKSDEGYCEMMED